jgi:enoyl-CoA hydratase
VPGPRRAAGRRLNAEAALACGLVAEIIAPEDLLGAAHRLLDGMTAWSPSALRLTKLVLDAPGAHPLADDLAQAVLFETEDKNSRMAKFLERRKA